MGPIVLQEATAIVHPDLEFSVVGRVHRARVLMIPVMMIIMMAAREQRVLVSKREGRVQIGVTKALVDARHGHLLPLQPNKSSIIPGVAESIEVGTLLPVKRIELKGSENEKV